MYTGQQIALMGFSILREHLKEIKRVVFILEQGYGGIKQWLLTSCSSHEAKDESFLLSGESWALLEHLLRYQQLLTLCVCVLIVCVCVCVCVCLKE